MCEKKFIDKSGRNVTIKIDDFGEEISVYIGGEKQGTISLSEREEIYPPDSSYFHITHLSLEKCKGNGIGRACLEFHRETFGFRITAASPYDTHKHEDGSYLTGDGPGFIQKMRDEGIVCPLNDKL